MDHNQAALNEADLKAEVVQVTAVSYYLQCAVMGSFRKILLRRQGSAECLISI